MVVQEGNIRKTMAARGLVNGRSRAISESSGGCSQRTAKWEGFSFPLLSSRTSLHPQKKQKLTFLGRLLKNTDIYIKHTSSILDAGVISITLGFPSLSSTSMTVS